MDVPGPDAGAARTPRALARTRRRAGLSGIHGALRGNSDAAIRYAERAIALASELGLPRPARALSCRGLARAEIGDPGGLDDQREAITLAIQAGNGHEAAVFHHNFALALAAWGGPAAALEEARGAASFARARGLTGVAEGLQGLIADMLADAGEFDEALAILAEITERPADEDLSNLFQARSVEARLLALRGESAKMADKLDWIEATSREFGSPGYAVGGLATSAAARSAVGQTKAAATLLTEIDAIPGAHEFPGYAAFLPEMVRTALAIGDPQLAERLVGGVEPRFPVAEHALVAASAALTEARGDLQAAADSYADAVARWERLGVVPEQAFALLGQGRCLLGLNRPTEATPVLQHAAEIFGRLQAVPALAETDALLERATELSS